MGEVQEYLDERRLIGTTVDLMPCRFRGLSVVVNLQARRARRHRARGGGRRARALHVPQPARRRQPGRAGRRLAVRPRAQPGRAVRDRARRPRRRVREDPADLRDRPRDRRAVVQAGRHAHRARARRADRLRPPHRQGGRTGRTSGGRQRQRERRRTGPSPAPASARCSSAAADRRQDAAASRPTARYLRGGLPAVYQEGDFGMRFVGALEPMLDPIVALLDALPAHFDPDLAPRDVLDADGGLARRRARRVAGHPAPARDGAPRRPSSAAAAGPCAGSSWRSS